MAAFGQAVVRHCDFSGRHSPRRHTESTSRKAGRFAAQLGETPRTSAQSKTALPLWKTRFLNEAEGARTLNLRIDSPML
jgi:hypothetical protein